MILVNIRMNVLSEKRMELSQTIASLSGSIRMEKGCRRCDFSQSVEDEDRLPGRERFRFYRERGYPLQNSDISGGIQ